MICLARSWQSRRERTRLDGGAVDLGRGHVEQTSPVLAEQPFIFRDPPSVRDQAEGVFDQTERVDHGLPITDARVLVEVAGRAGDFADLKPELNRLHQDLVVEQEVVGVLGQRQRTQHLRTVRAIAGVELAQVRAQHHVLKKSERPVGDITRPRHAALACVAAQHARTQDRLVHPGIEQVGHRRNQPRFVLVIGMQGHHDVRAALQGQSVALFQVAAKAAVLGLAEHEDVELGGAANRLVMALVVDQYHIVNDAAVDLRDRPCQRFRHIVRGHDHRDPL